MRWSQGLTLLWTLAGLSLNGCGETPYQRLLAADGDTRAVPGRLHGDRVHRPYAAAPATRGSPLPQLDVRVLTAAGREIEHAASVTEDSETLSDLGVLKLLSGDLDRSIAVLRAAATASHRPRPWNELSVAHLARFEIGRRPIDLLLAVDAAARSLDLERSPEALFNHALALTALGTRNLAAASWAAYEEIETDAAWRAEAKAMRQSLSQPAVEALWEDQEADLARRTIPLTTREAGALVSTYPFKARQFAEEVLLAQWAQQRRSAGDGARAELTLEHARRIAEAVQELRGEGLLQDAVRALQEVLESRSSRDRERLLAGLEHFGRGVAAYHDQRTATAEPLLVAAAADLDALGHPIANLARFYAAVCRYYEDAAAGYAELSQLAATVDEERHMALAGLVHWMLGTIDRIQGRLQSAVGHLVRAQSLLDRSSGAARSGFANVLVAEVYSMLGDHETGWSYRHRAFVVVPRTGEARRQIAMWTEAANALRRQQALSLARPLLDESVLVAQEWGKPFGLATAYLERSAYWAASDRQERALRDLERARSAIAEMEPGGLRDRTHAFSLVTEGRIHQRDDPDDSVALLSQAFALQEPTGFELDRIQFLTVRADAYRRLGEPARAKADFEQAISTFEGIRATVEDPFSRMLAFRSAQPAFESLMQLHLDDGEVDRDALFRLSERSRARVLRELIDPDGEARAVTLEELAAAMPAAVVVVEYSLLPDRLLAWVVSQRGPRMVVERLDSERLRRSIEQLRAAIERRAATDAIESLAGSLYERLILPLGLPADDPATLVVVPDRFLARVPWPALYDRRRQRPLIAERPISLSPSASLLVGSLAAPTAAKADGPTALAIGVGRATAYRGHRLEALTSAEDEATRVAAAYRRAQRLVGPRATRETFVAEAPHHTVLHFAGHALADPEVISRSVLLFHPENAGDSGDLPLARVLQLDLGHTELVVLSACRTLDTLADDREGLLGLGGTFLAAGVPAVLASLWDVDDRFAARLMPRFHQRYAAGEPAGTALRGAVLGLLRESPGTPPAAADWANFIVLGGVTR